MSSRVAIPGLHLENVQENFKGYFQEGSDLNDFDKEWLSQYSQGKPSSPGNGLDLQPARPHSQAETWGGRSVSREQMISRGSLSPTVQSKLDRMIITTDETWEEKEMRQRKARRKWQGTKLLDSWNRIETVSREVKTPKRLVSCRLEGKRIAFGRKSSSAYEGEEQLIDMSLKHFFQSLQPPGYQRENDSRSQSREGALSEDDRRRAESRGRTPGSKSNSRAHTPSNLRESTPNSNSNPSRSKTPNSLSRGRTPENGTRSRALTPFGEGGGGGSSGSPSRQRTPNHPLGFNIPRQRWTPVSHKSPDAGDWGANTWGTLVWKKELGLEGIGTSRGTTPINPTGGLADDIMLARCDSLASLPSLPDVTKAEKEGRSRKTRVSVSKIPKMLAQGDLPSLQVLGYNSSMSPRKKTPLSPGRRNLSRSPSTSPRRQQTPLSPQEQQTVAAAEGDDMEETRAEGKESGGEVNQKQRVDFEDDPPPLDPPALSTPLRKCRIVGGLQDQQRLWAEQEAAAIQRDMELSALEAEAERLEREEQQKREAELKDLVYLPGQRCGTPGMMSVAPMQGFKPQLILPILQQRPSVRAQQHRHETKKRFSPAHVFLDFETRKTTAMRGVTPLGGTRLDQLSSSVSPRERAASTSPRQASPPRETFAAEEMDEFEDYPEQIWRASWDYPPTAQDFQELLPAFGSQVDLDPMAVRDSVEATLYSIFNTKAFGPVRAKPRRESEVSEYEMAINLNSPEDSPRDSKTQESKVRTPKKGQVSKMRIKKIEDKTISVHLSNPKDPNSIYNKSLKERKERAEKNKKALEKKRKDQARRASQNRPNNLLQEMYMALAKDRKAGRLEPNRTGRASQSGAGRQSRHRQSLHISDENIKTLKRQSQFGIESDEGSEKSDQESNDSDSEQTGKKTETFGMDPIGLEKRLKRHVAQAKKDMEVATEVMLTVQKCMLELDEALKQAKKTRKSVVEGQETEGEGEESADGIKQGRRSRRASSLQGELSESSFRSRKHDMEGESSERKPKHRSRKKSVLDKAVDKFKSRKNKSSNSNKPAASSPKSNPQETK